MRAAKGLDEFGDFQTPLSLAAGVCRFLAGKGVRPAAAVEPTCGLGNFVISAVEQWPTAHHLGFEVNPAYVERLIPLVPKARIECQNFFNYDWAGAFCGIPEPILVFGNPPWITNARLGSLGSSNLPEKSNFQGRIGLDAITGKSNFDISEWMLIRLLEALTGHKAWLAMLCKTAVARKALLHAWKNGIGLGWAEIRGVDAKANFGAAVDACLLVCSIGGHSGDCGVYADLDAKTPTSVVGWCDGQLIADVRLYRKWKHLAGEGPYRWRSGVKHDCSKVMEFWKGSKGYQNGEGELVELEGDYLYPMLKSSELARGRIDDPVRFMLVTQRTVGEDTASIQQRAPKTWAYLMRNAKALDRRASSIYKNRPRFSVFGVGDYSFSTWKVGISGFYKRLQFAVIGDTEGRPTVLDDTGYFVACRSEREARLVASLLNSDAAREFYSAFVFWDAKRPITIDLLRRLDLLALAREQGCEFDLRTCLEFKAKWREQAGLFG